MALFAMLSLMFQIRSGSVMYLSNDIWDGGMMKRLWMHGATIDRALYYSHTARARLPPTYPFERQCYWLDSSQQKQQSSIQPARKPDIADWFYLSTWNEAPLTDQRVLERSSKTTTLVFADICGVGERLA